nr:MAG TPA: Transcription factor S-II (TFIIS) [Caudoviricetes sp.]
MRGVLFACRKCGSFWRFERLRSLTMPKNVLDITKNHS